MPHRDSQHPRKKISTRRRPRERSLTASDLIHATRRHESTDPSERRPRLSQKMHQQTPATSNKAKPSTSMPSTSADPTVPFSAAGAAILPSGGRTSRPPPPGTVDHARLPIGNMRGSAFQAEPRDPASVPVAVLIHHRSHAPPVVRGHPTASGTEKISLGSAPRWRQRQARHRFLFATRPMVPPKSAQRAGIVFPPAC
jgi:hypothetical protein